MLVVIILFIIILILLFYKELSINENFVSLDKYKKKILLNPDSDDVVNDYYPEKKYCPQFTVNIINNNDQIISNIEKPTIAISTTKSSLCDKEKRSDLILIDTQILGSNYYTNKLADIHDIGKIKLDNSYKYPIPNNS